MGRAFVAAATAALSAAPSCHPPLLHEPHALHSCSR